MEKVEQTLLDTVIKKIDEQWGEEVRFLQRIGQYPSTLGNEGALQNYIAKFLEKEMDLEVDVFVPDLKKISSHKGFSPPEWSYEGRPNVVGKLPTNGEKLGKSLILQGHIDVVPPNIEPMWNYDPWGSTIVGSKMYGRGIQDMKSGVAAMIFALKAIKDSGIELGSDVLVETVIEEECTGNGALATLVEGYKADGALIPEPFSQTALLGQVGVIWMRVSVKGSGAHVERASLAINAIEKAMILMESIQEYRTYINNLPKHEYYEDHPHPLNVNIGKIHSGEWASNVPSGCTFEVRVGIYPGVDPQKVKDELEEWVLKRARQDEWMKEVEPEITFYGFHAEGVALNKDNEIFPPLERAHKAITGKDLEYKAVTATTDVRFYDLYYDIPVTCYGPVGGNMHGVDEWVDLDSVKEVTKTYAAFILDWCKVRGGK
jgi:acetylornithine deacetylase